MKQTEMILRHLQAGHSLTQLDAMTLFGCSRLAARIHDLRSEGHQIDEERVTAKNRWGKDCRISRYSFRRPVRTTLFDLPGLGRPE